MLLQNGLSSKYERLLCIRTWVITIALQPSIMRHQQNCIVLGAPRFKAGTEKAEGNLQEREKSDEGFRNHNLGETEKRILHGDSDQLFPLRTESREIIQKLLL